LFEFGLAVKGAEIVISLRANAKVRLQVKRSAQ